MGRGRMSIMSIAGRMKGAIRRFMALSSLRKIARKRYVLKRIGIDKRNRFRMVAGL